MYEPVSGHYFRLREPSHGDIINQCINEQAKGYRAIEAAQEELLGFYVSWHSLLALALTILLIVLAWAFLMGLILLL